MPNKDRYIQLIHDGWLTKLFQYEVIQLVICDCEDLENRELLKSILPILDKKPVFVYSKVPVNTVNAVHKLENLGFRLVDTNISFEKDILKPPVQPEGNLNLRFADPGDLKLVKKIAKSNFAASRFHLDPRIPDELANTIKAEWAANYFRKKRGDAMVVSEIEDQIAGFLQIIFARNILVIDLIAVDQAFRCQGAAGHMIAYAISELTEFDRIRVGTQIANFPSMRFYSKHNFKVVNAQYIFHYHRNE